MSSCVKSSDPIWLHWTLASSTGQRGHKKYQPPKRVRCRHCLSKVTLANAKHCKGHLISCPKAPDDVRNYFRAVLKAAKNVKNEEEEEEKEDVESMEMAAAAANFEAGSAEDDVTEPLSILVSDEETEKTDSGVGTLPSASSTASSSSSSGGALHGHQEPRQSLLNDLFAKAMLSGDVPISWADNHFLKLFLNKLDPTFELPSAERMADVVLTRIHKQCETEILDKVSDVDNLSIILSRVFNDSNKPKLVVMLSSPENLWYKAKEMCPATDSPRALQAYLERAINNLGVLKVSSVITNNPKATKLAIERICKQWPHIIPLKCPYRALCMLFDDVCRLASFHDLLNRAKCIVRQLGTSSTLSHRYGELFLQAAPFQANGCLRLCRTARWHVTMDLMVKLLNSKAVLNKMASDDQGSLFSDANRRALLDDGGGFWRKIEIATKFLKPLVNAIAALETNNAMISELPEILCSVDELFVDINLKLLNFTSAEMEKAKACHNSRVSGRFLTKYHRLANFLDPKYRGRDMNVDLNEPSLTSALQTLEEYGKALGLFDSAADIKDACNCLASFRRHEKVFSLPLLACSSGATFWANLQTYKTYRVLATVATKILAIPASAASVERSLTTKGTPPDADWLGTDDLDRIQTVKWVLGKHIEETNEMLDDMLVDVRRPSSDSTTTTTTLAITKRLETNVAILDDVFVLPEPFSDAELLKPGQTNCEDCVLLHNTLKT